MKKIININFHSRVIPIEETAYEILQQYIDSLRRYFAHEEGRDEIISDIENRFSELFSDKLKKGVPCITDDDVNAIIASMGRPEEFEGEESAGASASSGSQAGGGASAGANSGGPSQQQSSGQGQYETSETRRLYRAGNDKILGGVCSGLANYLRLDPAIVRIIFVLITFTWGFGFLLYILLWIILPTRSLPVNARKRLYRNSDDRVIGGVASGLAAYFHIDVWIPRLIFALPLILGVVTSIIRSAWWFHFHFGGPVFFTGGFGGTLFITYIVLWMVLPEAVSASEKLEMRGEKVDLESIKNTVKSDLETFKGRAKEMGSEMQERFQQVGQQVRQGTQTFTSEAGPVIRRGSSGIGHAIGVLFKAFFLFIAGLIAFGLIVGLISLAFAGDGVLELKNYILSGFWQNFLAWSSFILFLVTPVVALLTWLIRRITGIRSRTHYLGYMFATLWVLGLISVVTLGGLIMSNFRSRQHVEDEITMTQPSTGRMVIKAMQPAGRIYDTDWWFAGDWRHHGPFYNLNDDSILLTTIRVNVLKSEDAQYHVRVLRFSRSDNSHAAMALAQQISFPVRQSDSILNLPAGFTINMEQKFRNQQVLVAISVPVGKKILLDKSIRNYEWFNVSTNNRHIHWSYGGNDEDSWEDATDLENAYPWSSNVEYIMTTDGLSRADRAETDRKEQQEKAERPEQPERKEQDENGNKKHQHDTNNDGYRYKGPEKPARKSGSDTPVLKSTTMLSVPYSSQFVLLSTLVNPL